MKLNEKIFYYRKRAKLSQEELAARVGVSRQAVSKWELGEATPEVGKLAALARAFGVTVDELLSQEPPAGEQVPPEAAVPPEAGKAERKEDVFDRSVGLLGRLIRRYGWLAGVRIALSGLGITLVGALARFLFGAMFQTSNSMLSGFGGMGGVVIEGAENLPPEALWQITGDLGGGFGGMFSRFGGVESAFLTFVTIILLAGLGITIAGVVLAVYLYRRGNR